MYHIYKKLKFITKKRFLNNGGKTISDDNFTY